jgi:hypothetical protein
MDSSSSRSVQNDYTSLACGVVFYPTDNSSDLLSVVIEPRQFHTNAREGSGQCTTTEAVLQKWTALSFADDTCVNCRWFLLFRIFYPSRGIVPRGVELCLPSHKASQVDPDTAPPLLPSLPLRGSWYTRGGYECQIGKYPFGHLRLLCLFSKQTKTIEG